VPQLHEFPTVTQFASPDLIGAFTDEGRAFDTDPRWAESGAPDRETYGRWCNHICGMACLRMALLARTGTAPTLFELLDGARKYGGYVEDPETGFIRGLIYAPFVRYVLDTHPLKAETHAPMPVPMLFDLLDDGRLVMASVHRMIRRPDEPAPGKGGHLVLVTGHDGDMVHFRNPSGHTDESRTARLPIATFAEFFAERGVSLT
jgi:hypothetical protein